MSIEISTKGHFMKNLLLKWEIIDAIAIKRAELSNKQGHTVSQLLENSDCTYLNKHVSEKQCRFDVIHSLKDLSSIITLWNKIRLSGSSFCENQRGQLFSKRTSASQISPPASVIALQLKKKQTRNLFCKLSRDIRNEDNELAFVFTTEDFIAAWHWWLQPFVLRERFHQHMQVMQ